MAGVLPGVEYARRRRLYQNGGNSSDNGSGVRRPTSCLYTSNHENGSLHSSITTTLLQRSIQNQGYDDQNLGGVAREARERLDEKLRLQRKLSDSKSKRQERSSSLRIVDARTMEALGEIQTVQVLRSAKWWKWGMKLRWKSNNSHEQEECPICIDGFKVEDQVVQLPCAHKFHTKCLLPWLLNNAHCPCCRMLFHIQFPSSS